MPGPDRPLPAILPLGADALIVRFSLTPDLTANAAAQVLASELASGNTDGICEIVPSLASLMLRFDPERLSRAALTSRVAATLDKHNWASITPPAPTRRWVLPAAFGGKFGPQLEEAAQAAGIPPAQALQELTSTRLRVLAIGFAPGQPFLGLLPDHWNFPRLSELTPQVPAGALVAAVRQIVLFANPSATGWRQVGQTTFRPFRPQSDTPFPLRTGDEVVFEAIDHTSFAALQAKGAEAADIARLELLA